MADNILIHDNADKTPPPAPGRHPLTPISGADFDRTPRRRMAPQGWIVLTLIVLAPILWLIWRLDAALRDFFARYPAASDGLLWLLLALIVLSLVGLCGTLAARAWLSVQHARIVRSRHGVPLDVVAQMRLDPYDLEAQAVGLELARAPYLMHPNLSTQSVSQVLPKGIDTPPVLALPDQGPQIVSAAQWLTWINSLPHTLLAAETGGGKSTTAKHILAPRLQAGEAVFIIDPHSSQWYDLPVVGGGENWSHVEQALIAIEQEYRRRLAERETYRRATGRELPVDHFPRLTVLLDEANNTRFALDHAPRGKLSIWERFTQVMGSGARKTHISLILLAQSANVEDFGMTAAMRENFTRIALDSAAARKLIASDETNPERRKGLLAALEGREYPAVCEYKGQVHLLDRAGLNQAPMLASVCDRAWDGWNYLTDAPVCLSDEEGALAPLGTAQTDRRTDGGQQDADMLRETLVISLKRARRNREQIRQELQELGMALDNNEYRTILAKHGLS